MQNGATVVVQNGGVVDLEGGTMDFGGAGATARLDERGTGRVTGGQLTATRVLDQPSGADPAGLGAQISASVDLGEVAVTRGHAVQTGGGNESIERFYDISPSKNNSGLSATLTHSYADAELNGLDESKLELFKSTDGGQTWSEEGFDSRDATANTVTLGGIESLNRWTLGSEASSLAKNLPPVARLDRYEAPINSTLQVDPPGVLGNDTDPNGDPLTAALVRGLSGLRGGQRLTFRSDGSFEYDPQGGGGPGSRELFVYEARDGRGGADQDSVLLEIVRPSPPDTGNVLALSGLEAQVVEGPAVRLQWQAPGEAEPEGMVVLRQAPGTEGFASVDAPVRAKDAPTDEEPKGAAKPRGFVARVSDLEPGTHRFEVRIEGPEGTAYAKMRAEVTVRMDEALRLTAPTPNPVRREATLRFGVREARPTEVVVYDLLGQRVATLYEGTPAAGQMQTLRLEAGALPTGPYFVRLQSGTKVRTRRVTVVR